MASDFDLRPYQQEILERFEARHLPRLRRHQRSPKENTATNTVYEVRGFYGPACTEQAFHAWGRSELARDMETGAALTRKDIGRVEQRVQGGTWRVVPRTAILTGPQGSGKTQVALALAGRLGCERVVEEWWPGQPLTKHALHLTHEPVDQPTFEGVRVYRIEEVR